MDAGARALILLTIACSDPAPRAEVIDGCTIDPVETWIEPANGSLGIAPPMIALVDRGIVTTRARGQHRRRFSLHGAEAVLAIDRVGAHYVLSAYGACGGAPCLIAQLLDRAGAKLGDPIRSRFTTHLRSAQRAADDTAAYFAWSDGGARSLEIWRVESGRLAHESRALGEEPADDEVPVEVLGVAAHEGEWTVVWRRGTPEAHESEIFVTTNASHSAIEALHHAVAIESLAIDGGVVTTIASFEYSRPHRVTLRGGEVVSRAEIATDDASDGVQGHLDRDGDTLWFRRRTGAGDPIGERIAIARGDFSEARITESDGDWIVAWLANGAVCARSIRCE